MKLTKVNYKISKIIFYLFLAIIPVLIMIITYYLYHKKSGESEEYCHYISSRGFAKSCHLKSNNLQSTNANCDDIINEIESLKKSSTVYFCNTAIKSNFINIFNKIKEPITIVSGDSDDTMDESFFKNILPQIETEKIVKWYCQNCTFSHPKIFQLPIGLDLHSVQDISNPITPIEHEKMIKDIIKHSKPFYERKLLCYSNFHFQIQRHPDRQDAYDKVPKELVFYEKDRTDRETTYRKQTEYAFVLSPHGNGLDCHRTWEALILGCIPIVKKSGLDPLYDNLPVLIVTNWDDVTEELLTKTVEDYKSKKFDMNKLTLKYWTSLLK
jgi:hypothetical protein